MPSLADKADLRQQLGLENGEQLVVVSVGGSGVGLSLIRRVVGAAPLLRRNHPGLRILVVTGPRISSALLPATDGVSYRSFEPELRKLLAACDLAIVQDGLSTCMELAATATPFIYVPLQNHFEQLVHVPKRLRNYGAGLHLDFGNTIPEALAAAVSAELPRGFTSRPVERDGAARAAGLISDLLT